MAAKQTERDTEAKAKMVWQSQPFLTLKGHTSWVRCVAWSPEGDQLASCSADKSIIIWDVASGQQVSTLKGHTWAVNSVPFPPFLFSGRPNKQIACLFHYRPMSMCCLKTVGTTLFVPVCLESTRKALH